MIELKKDIMETFDKINKAWVEAVRDGTRPESDGIDLTEVLDKYSALMTEFDDKFNQGMQRLKDKKGKFW
jgi:hypothetical protein